MNYIKHLTGFFDRIVQDRNLNPTHISLYIALFQFWNINRFKNPISITRDEVMRISKICSKATYHKCMRELNEKGYLKYEPSFNPYKGSMVILFNFSEDLKPVQKRANNSEKILPNTEQVRNKQGTSAGTGTEQALVPSINYINKTNNLNILNLDEQPQNFENDNLFSEEKKEKEKSSAKKEMPFPFADTNEKQTEKSRQKFVTSSAAEKPTNGEIKTYFQQQNFPELEAQKFFNYFSSNGWLVGGKTPMVDWTAAAQNWMLNANKFSTNEKPNRAKHLNTPTDKNYAEPL
ncbi:transcriptional regulator [Flavobacterium sp. ZT3R18]|uniref:transcriptional regulator n=1 Tax=Flavobacterium sp. ZT3R18 TaxID=2594429 RepID=UPI00117AFB9A|nr:transcriptional regulator [Flavobacterium sp. ZT3R18]TRX32981.1 transcriptional regulator [Flavobacterium sp. ZT3R18]